MLELIIKAIGSGILISLVLVGPVFFLLIETSISKGHKAALALNLGVIASDLLCISVAVFSSYDLLGIINRHPGFYRITAFIILIYAFYMILSKTKTHIAGESRLVTKNYIKTFINGFLLNIINVGVVVFWMITVISIRSHYPDMKDFFIYITITMVTLFGLDLIKIYLARQLHKKIKPQGINWVRRIVGGILVAFSVIIFMKSLGYFKSIDQEIHPDQSTQE